MSDATLDAPRADADPEPIVRPSLGKLIWYCYGGSLPAVNRGWVLHDVTCRTWFLRHFARWTMVTIPIFCLFMLPLPSSFAVRLYIGIAVCGAVYMFALVNILIDTDRRAVRAGYSYNLPQEIRASRSIERQRTSNYERRERIAARRARRR